MSIVFQLFSANDLKMYTDKKALTNLRVEIGFAARQPENALASAKKDQYLPKVIGDARSIASALSAELKSKYQEDMTQALRERAREIFRQCRGFDPIATSEPLLIDFSTLKFSDPVENLIESIINEVKSQSENQEKVSQKLTKEEIKQLIKDRINQEKDVWEEFQRYVLHEDDWSRLSDLEKEILKLGITCELDYFNEYHAVNAVKESAHAAFLAAIRNRAQGPDSFYALLNRIP